MTLLIRALDGFDALEDASLIQKGSRVCDRFAYRNQTMSRNDDRLSGRYGFYVLADDSLGRFSTILDRSTRLAEMFVDIFVVPNPGHQPRKLIVGLLTWL